MYCGRWGAFLQGEGYKQTVHLLCDRARQLWELEFIRRSVLFAVVRECNVQVSIQARFGMRWLMNSVNVKCPLGTQEVKQ